MLWALSVVVAFGAGLFLHDIRDLKGVEQVDRGVPPVEEFLDWTSYSEVDETRSLLRALCLHSMAEIRVRYLEHRGAVAADSNVTEERIQEGLSAAIRELREQLGVFEGTTEEWLLHSELLRLLGRARREPEWLDTYLDILYRNPTLSTVESQLPRARLVAARLDRTPELERAVSHWMELPSNQRQRLLSPEPSRGWVKVPSPLTAPSEAP